MRRFGWMLLLMSFCLPVMANGELTAFSGKKQGIEQHLEKGKWLVVMIWASDCHVCNKEAHSYDAFHKKHKSKDAKIVGLSIDGKIKKREAQKFIERHKVSFPNMLGEPKEVMNLYFDLTGDTTFGTPSFLVYGPKGNLIAGQVGAVPPALIETFIKEESSKIN